MWMQMHGLVEGSGVDQRARALLTEAVDGCHAGKQQSVFSSGFPRKVAKKVLHGIFDFLKLNKTTLEMQTKKCCVGQEITSASRIQPLGSQCASSNQSFSATLQRVLTLMGDIGYTRAHPGARE